MTSAPAFTGSVRMHDGVAVVILAGEIDLAAAPQLRSLLQDAVATGAGSVVLDTADVSFCDATGLGLFVGADTRLHAAGGQLSLRAVPVVLRRLLSLTGLLEALGVSPVPGAGPLTADLVAAAGQPLNRAVLDAALKLVVVMSQSVMKGADGVSITLPRDGRLRTVAASNDVVLHMDHDQYDTGQGPCLDAAKEGKLFSSTALALERRWPQFVPRARARGIESIMSTPLMAAGRPLGALNVYSRAPASLASHEQDWAIEFADQTANVLLAAEPATGDSVAAEILDALRSREVISLAQGCVMSSRRLSAEAARRYLTQISRRTGRPLLEICQELVDATSSDRHDAAPDQGSSR